jgi:hypothetical protein
LRNLTTIILSRIFSRPSILKPKPKLAKATANLNSESKKNRPSVNTKAPQNGTRISDSSWLVKMDPRSSINVDPKTLITYGPNNTPIFRSSKVFEPDRYFKTRGLTVKFGERHVKTAPGTPRRNSNFSETLMRAGMPLAPQPGKVYATPSVVRGSKGTGSSIELAVGKTKALSETTLNKKSYL